MASLMLTASDEILKKLMDSKERPGSPVVDAYVHESAL